MALPIVEGVEFRAIEGWPGYAVGNDGSVWTQKEPGACGRLWDNWRRMKHRTDAYGYAIVELRHNGTVKLTKVHRLVLSAFVCKCPQGMEASHCNGVRDDNRLSNLRWDTHRNNVADKIKHGTQQHGEKSGAAKLTDNDVREIRNLLYRGERQSVIATRYGVSRPTIGYIKQSKTWTHVT